MATAGAGGVIFLCGSWRTHSVDPMSTKRILRTFGGSKQWLVERLRKIEDAELIARGEDGLWSVVDNSSDGLAAAADELSTTGISASLAAQAEREREAYLTACAERDADRSNEPAESRQADEVAIWERPPPRGRCHRGRGPAAGGAAPHRPTRPGIGHPHGIDEEAGRERDIIEDHRLKRIWSQDRPPSRRTGEPTARHQTIRGCIASCDSPTDRS